MLATVIGLMAAALTMGPPAVAAPLDIEEAISDTLNSNSYRCVPAVEAVICAEAHASIGDTVVSIGRGWDALTGVVPVIVNKQSTHYGNDFKSGVQDGCWSNCQIVDSDKSPDRDETTIVTVCGIHSIEDGGIGACTPPTTAHALYR